MQAAFPRETGVDKRTILAQAEKKRKRDDAARQKKEFREFQVEFPAVKDDINPEKHLHLRAANAEEALIAYVFPIWTMHGVFFEQLRRKVLYFV